MDANRDIIFPELKPSKPPPKILACLNFVVWHPYYGGTHTTYSSSPPGPDGRVANYGYNHLRPHTCHKAVQTDAQINTEKLNTLILMFMIIFNSSGHLPTGQSSGREGACQAGREIECERVGRNRRRDGDRPGHCRQV